MQFKSKVVALSVAAVATSVVAAMPAMAAVDESDLAACAAPSGPTYTLTEDCYTFSTLVFPDGATLDGNGHTILAVEDAAHPNFPGPVVKSATGTDVAPASLTIRDLTIDTDFSGSNSGGKLAGVEMLRAGGSLSDVAVNGITHGNGVQEGNAISIRNRVSGDDINVPRATVTLEHVTATNYQKTGVLLDGNLSFTATDLTVGTAGTPDGQPIAAGVIGANSVQISRGAQGSLTDSTVATNFYDGKTSTAVLLYNARNVELARNAVAGPGDMGVYAYNTTHTITTKLAMRDMTVENTAGLPAETSVGVFIDKDESIPGSLNATITDSTVTGWGTDVVGAELTNTPVEDVTGHATTAKVNRKARIDMYSDALPAGAVQGRKLTWRIKVDGKRASVYRQNVSDHDAWVHRFQKNTGVHKVELFKNGVLVKTVKVRTNA